MIHVLLAETARRGSTTEPAIFCVPTTMYARGVWLALEAAELERFFQEPTLGYGHEAAESIGAVRVFMPAGRRRTDGWELRWTWGEGSRAQALRRSWEADLTTFWVRAGIEETGDGSATLRTVALVLPAPQPPRARLIEAGLLDAR